LSDDKDQKDTDRRRFTEEEFTQKFLLGELELDGNTVTWNPSPQTLEEMAEFEIIPKEEAERLRIDEDIDFLEEINEVKHRKYLPIAVPIHRMSPSDFKHGFKGKFSNLFKRVKDRHNVFLGLKNQLEILKMVKKGNFYGFIYKIEIIGDGFRSFIGDTPSLIIGGKEKLQGINRLGQTVNLKTRFNEYYRGRNRLKFTIDYILGRILDGEFSKNVRVSLLAACKTKKELDATEVFWTLYFNRDESHNEGYSLSQNDMANMIVGDLGTSRSSIIEEFLNPVILKTKLLIDIMNGLTLKGLMEKYNYLIPMGISLKALSNRLQSCFSTQSSIKVLGDLVDPLLCKYLRDGYSDGEIIKSLIESGFNAFITRRRFRIDESIWSM